ncbi:MAG: hypothetical protein FJY85_04915, partial [Deltaproteobacteria bacterium]|nr:hypothetical protein [Deltaproteobacteria bacterium]
MDKLTRKTLREHQEFLKSFLDMNRATVLYSSGIGERVPEPVRKRFETAVKHSHPAKKEIEKRYKLLMDAAKKADLESILAQITMAVRQHSHDLHELSGLCSVVDLAPQSLNYCFLYEGKGTGVEECAKTIFRVLRAGLSSSRTRTELSDAVLEVREMAQSGNAFAKLLLAHIKTKARDDSQDEGAIQDLEEGKKLLGNGQKHMEAYFDFVKNIAEYHLGRLDAAISGADRLARESDGKTPRFHLQAGFLHWCRYQQDPKTRSDDLDIAIDLTWTSEQLSKDEPETHPLALANLARAYAERARLSTEDRDGSAEHWEMAIGLIDDSVEECGAHFGEAHQWPACIVFAAAFVWYESLRRTYDANTVSPQEARNACAIMKEKLSELLPVLDDNRRWQRPRVAEEYKVLLNAIGRYRRTLEDKAQGMSREVGDPGQAPGAGPAATIDW